MSDYLINLKNTLLSNNPGLVVQHVYYGFIESEEPQGTLIVRLEDTESLDEFSAEVEKSKIAHFKNFEPGTIFHMFVGSLNEAVFVKIIPYEETWTQEQIDIIKKQAEQLSISLSKLIK